jgi:hypothetical protein
MNPNQPSQMDPVSAEAVREAWKKPSLTRLRCGGAENVPGDAVSDATLETIGS